jgi:diguanylate cyclase (GGDEF)-like protein
MLYNSSGIIERQLIYVLSLPVFSFVILCIIAYRMYRNQDMENRQTRLFMSLIWLNAVQLAVDALSACFDVFNCRFAGVCAEALSVADLLFQTIIPCVWMCFVLEVTGKKSCLTKWPGVVSFFPGLAVIVILFATPFTGAGFIYNGTNVYERTPGTYFIIFVDLMYLLAAYIVVFRARYRMGRRKTRALLGFALPPAAGGILEIFFPFLDITWPLMTISLLVNYLAVQNEQILFDHLTGVNNRRSLDIALRRKINGSQRSDFLGLLLIDLDKFKSINDTYGHLEGDTALEATAQILRKCFHHGDFIARYGGDEFLVIVDMHDKNDIQLIEKRVQTQVSAWNRTSGKPWKIEFSIGSISYPPDAAVLPEDCLREIDLRLYEKKKAKYTVRL